MCYKSIPVENFVRYQSKRAPNVYFLVFFACCRQITNKSTKKNKKSNSEENK